MKKVLNLLLVVGCLLAVSPSSSHAQDDPPVLPADWEVALYDISTREVVIVRPDGVEKLATPECFAVSTDTDYYLIKFSHIVAVSPDYRFVVVGMDNPSHAGILVADRQQETCFEALVEAGFMGMSPGSLDTLVLASAASRVRSENYRYDVAVFGPDGTQLAFSYAPQCSEGTILIVDLVESPGTVLQKLDWTEGSAFLEDWRKDGIYFYSSYGCEPGMIGTLKRWEPTTRVVTDTGESFTRVYGDTLSLTGETLVLIDYEEEYPNIRGMNARNVILYSSEDLAAVVYYDPASTLSPPIWVLDGNAFFIEQTLVFRDSSTLTVPNGVCAEGTTMIEGWLTQGILAGTPDGWLTQHGSQLHHCQMVNGEIVSTVIDAKLNSPAVVLRQSPLGTTVSENMTPLPFAETFRLSFCGNPAQAPRLGGTGRTGHITTAEPQRLYSDPDANSTALGTFTTFEIVNGPYCAAPNTIWWLLEAGDQTGWAPERSDDQQLLALDCPDEFSSPFQVGAQVVYDGTPPPVNGARLHSMPAYMGVPLSEITLGQTVNVLDGPVCDGNSYWWLVDYQGQVGWIIELKPLA